MDRLRTTTKAFSKMANKYTKVSRNTSKKKELVNYRGILLDFTFQLNLTKRLSSVKELAMKQLILKQYFQEAI